jgi:dimethylhistidine N-methyltransferase
MNPSRTTIGRHHETITGRHSFQRDVIEGLSRPRKAIPCKYFYDDRGSALFDEICELDEYYLTRTELAILRAHVDEMATAMGEDCDLIELGSGSGLKTRLLLEHLREPRAYLPIDISPKPLARSAADLARGFPWLAIHPVCADFTGPVSLPETGTPRARRVVYFPGSTIGNFRPRAALGLLRSIALMVGEGGGLLIGFDLDKDESLVEPAYNDRRGVTAEFNLNLLARINRELGADFDLRAFEHRAVYIRVKERLEMHLVSRKAQIVRVDGRLFSFQEGETIHTEYSYKYSLEHFGRLASRAGFSLGRQWFDPNRHFCVQYLTGSLLSHRPEWLLNSRELVPMRRMFACKRLGFPDPC